MGLAGPHIIELAKIVDYLLDASHPTGRAKAAFFTAFGFNVATPTILMNAVEDHARSRPVVNTIKSPYGIKHEVRCYLRAPDGRDPCVVAVWLQASGTTIYRFITAYPA